VKNDNLIAATQGRSFWIIDDLTPLHQLEEKTGAGGFHLFKPVAAYRMGGGQPRTISKTQGRNHPGGVPIQFFLKDTTAVQASLEILESNGTVIKTFLTKPDKKKKEEELKIKPGMNTFVWNTRYADAETFDGIILWAASTAGPKAIPGNYKAKLTVNGTSMETDFEIRKDPRTTASVADIKEQFDFLIAVRNKLSETNKAIKKIRSAREQINRVTDPLKDKDDMKDLTDLAKSIQDDIRKIEEALYQTKNKSGQDPLNYPVRLNNKLAALGSEADGSDFKPTEQVKAVYAEISSKIDSQLKELDVLLNQKLPQFNELVRKKNINAVMLTEN
jgi:hypothetical protein